MKCRVDKMSCWQNVMLTKCRVDKMLCWQNVVLTKCRVDKMSCWQNIVLMKCRVHEMSSWNVVLMKCRVDEMSCWWNVVAPKTRPFQFQFRQLVKIERQRRNQNKSPIKLFRRIKLGRFTLNTFYFYPCLIFKSFAQCYKWYNLQMFSELECLSLASPSSID